MAYPLMEHLTGNGFLYCGKYYRVSSELTESLQRPVDIKTYYETVRVKDGVLLFVEDHLARLVKSVKGLENFPVDTAGILSEAYSLIDMDGVTDGSIRIVLTKESLLIHQADITLPSEELFEQGINTSLLNWERQTPNLKIFRGDYKTKVNEKFREANSHGLPFELVLSDNDGRLYEGSMSNLFVIRDGQVYSAPDEKILIGITRKRVREALKRSGLELQTGTFRPEELDPANDAVFVSSTPFDILPVRYIDDYEFRSSDNEILKMISKMYREYTSEYIDAAKRALNG
ncbi:MAG: aminotransferase class IV [Aeriscardovia sp.]|nr:aminotransferase class IV [Aeriscardovia sp.]MBR3463161.1 aminotransferase class IV [Clostridiales bacterium]